MFLPFPIVLYYYIIQKYSETWKEMYLFFFFNVLHKDCVLIHSYFSFFHFYFICLCQILQ